MGAERNRLVALAAAVSDGDPVDWAAELAAAPARHDAELLGSLRLLASISDAHRILLSDPAAVPAQADSGETATARGGATDATVVAPEEEPLPPWGPLQIVEKTGGGAFGDVYRAWDPRLDREVALKLLRESPGEGTDRASLFIQEGRLLARVRHHNVATVHGAEVHQGRAGLWMEFVRGRTLEDLLREQGPLGAREAALIGLDLCRALAAVHRAGLVHRDLKAQNVMREEGGRIVLMDFGAGRNLPADDAEPDRDIAGTPLYMAPEVLTGRGSATHSDIYSLGVLLYRLATSDFPVRGRNLAELREAHASGASRLLRDVRPDLPEPFVQAVERALAREPSERFASAGEFERALAAALGVEAREKAAPAGRRSGARRVWAVAGVAAGLAAVALAAWGLREWRGGVPSGPPGAQPEPVFRTAESVARDAAPTLLAPAPPTAATPPPDVKATMYRWGPVYSKALSSGGAVQRGDELYLEVQSNEAIHLYVINQDRKGRAFVLFPLPGSEPSNPLAAGVRHQLPGTSTEKKKRLLWSVDTAGGKETFLIVAAREPLRELERDLAAIKHARIEEQIEVSPATVTRLRGVGAAVTKESPAGSTTGGSEAMKRLSEAGAIEGVWVREIVLDNPGS